MAVVELNRPDPLLGGFYTVQEAARILNIENPRRIYGWLSGYGRTDAGPIIKRQYEPIGGKQEVGFLDLMEIRFIEYFRRRRFSLQSLRKAAINARRELQVDHPFAASDVKFMSDRKQIFLAAARETGDRFVINLMTNQVEMYEALEQALAKGVLFDPYSGLARQWRPSSGDFPNIVLDPRIAYGKPSVAPENVPTAALFNLWKAEKGNADLVADWYSVHPDKVREAIAYELRPAA